jgi:DNA-binding response OmpR family regulator
MKKILVVDDETSIRDLLEMVLVREGYAVGIAENGKKALEMINSFEPDLIILDLMLPDMDGHEVCRKVTSEKHTPIIMLTAKNELIDKVLGLELGADDYLTKPFETRELLARIKALLRRSDKHEELDIIKHKNLEINLSNKTVLKNNKQVAVTPREFQLLEVLAKNPKRVYSRDELMTRAWGYEYTGDSRSVDICITRMRKKIEEDKNNPEHIITVYGFGYRFGEA